MRDRATYRSERRNMARALMRARRAQGKPRNWRDAWAAVQAVQRLSKQASKQGPKP